MDLKRIFNKYLVVWFLWLFSCGTEQQKNSDTEASSIKPAAEQVAKSLFENNCAACHGNDGTAGISGAANLQTIPLNLDLIEFTISNGRGNMPAYKKKLTNEEIELVGEYIRILRK